jgi:hypothetical protein
LALSTADNRSFEYHLINRVHWNTILYNPRWADPSQSILRGYDFLTTNNNVKITTAHTRR